MGCLTYQAALFFPLPTPYTLYIFILPLSKKYVNFF